MRKLNAHSKTARKWASALCSIDYEWEGFPKSRTTANCWILETTANLSRFLIHAQVVSQICIERHWTGMHSVAIRENILCYLNLCIFFEYNTVRKVEVMKIHIAKNMLRHWTPMCKVLRPANKNTELPDRDSGIFPRTTHNNY